MATKITKKGKTRWYARVQKDGRIKTKLCRSRAEALEWEANLRGTEDWGQTPIDSLTLHEWASKYLDHAQLRFSPKTYQEKRALFKRLLETMGPQKTVVSMTPKTVLGFLMKQSGKRSGCSLNKDRKNIQAAWNWGVKYLGLPYFNPAAVVERFPEQRRPRYVPPEEDFWKVFDLAEGQDKVMLAVALYTAARRGEIFRLTWPDVDFSQNRIRLYTRKRRDGSLEFDWLPLAGELRDYLRWWWEHRPFKRSPHVFAVEDEGQAGTGYLGEPFKVRRTFLKKLCEKAEVYPFGFHGIRHLTATILYQKGYPVAVIQLILRHKNATTTTRYLHSLGVEEVRPALESLGRQKADVIRLPERQRL